MKENEENENENENENIINRNSSKNTIIREFSKSILSSSVISLNEENRQTISSITTQVNNKYDNLKLGSKILCPEKDCFLNSIQ